MKKGMILVLLLLLSCVNRVAYEKETPILTELAQLSVVEIEKIARVKIPSSASDIRTYAETGWMDDVALIRFNLPSADLNFFLESHNFKNLKQGHWSIQNAPPSVTWWPRREINSTLPIALYWGDTHSFPSFSQSVLVDKSIEDIYTVYLQYFEK
jgi:hypothetical protein